MKKLLLLLFTFFSFSTLAFASVRAVEHHVVWSYLPSEVELEVAYAGPGENNSNALKFFTKNEDLLEIKDFDLKSHDDYQYLYPASPNNGYEWWFLNGSYGEERIFILGYAVDTGGDGWFYFAIDLILLAVLIVALIFAVKYFVNRKG